MTYTTNEIEDQLARADAGCALSPTLTADIWHEALNGGSGAHRITCTNGLSYAAKFPGTPHQDWILGREYGFTTLANAYDPGIALSAHAIAMSSTFVANAPSTVSYTITGLTAVGTTWVDSAVDTKIASGSVTVTSYPPELWASIIVFQTWAGAEDPAALATNSRLLSVDHGWYMQPSTLTGNGPANVVCAASLSPPDVLAHARPALPVALARLEALPSDAVIRAFAGHPDAWWSFGRRERAQVVAHLLDRRSRVADWLTI